MDGRIKAYQTTETLGKSQIELIVKVYDGAIASYVQAKTDYENKLFEEGYDQLERGKKFLTHLYTTLDTERGGEIAESLGKLYAFVINQTQMAESTKEISLIESNIEILDNLRNGWLGIREMDARQESGGQNEQETAGMVVSG